MAKEIIYINNNDLHILASVSGLKVIQTMKREHMILARNEVTVGHLGKRTIRE
jgi:hypothetical protein